MTANSNSNDFLDGFFLVRSKFLRMLKGLVPVREIFLFHEIYILFDFTFIQ